MIFSINNKYLIMYHHIGMNGYCMIMPGQNGIKKI